MSEAAKKIPEPVFVKDTGGIDVLEDVNTYLLLPADPHEASIAIAWRDRLHPNTKAKTVQSLKLDRLVKEMRVIPLLRKGVKGRPRVSPIFSMMKNPQTGLREIVHHSYEDFIEEIVVCPQIDVADYFREPQGLTYDPYSMSSDGDLDNGRFLEALGKSVVPWTYHYNDKQLPGIVTIHPL